MKMSLRRCLILHVVSHFLPRLKCIVYVLIINCSGGVSQAPINCSGGVLQPTRFLFPSTYVPFEKRFEVCSILLVGIQVNKDLM